MPKPDLDIRPEVAKALASGPAVVALESTVISHGLPWPMNFEVACQMEEAVRSEGAVPATISIWQGVPTIGLQVPELEALARNSSVIKASRRDLAFAVTHRLTAGTTVAATMALAHCAGIRLFATGGIGGVHHDYPTSSDISADLHELARTPVAVVCAGAKSVLDLPRTLEYLETLGVPVVGYQTDEFPAFYLRSSGLPVSARVDSADGVAALAHAHWHLGGGGLIVTQPIDANAALEPDELAQALEQAQAQARQEHVRGKDVTPFLLARLADLTHGRTLQANQALLLANARLAARVALALERDARAR